ncbi:MAG TPA: 50S ribosomal protein L10 [Candidatus Nanoarchaeia archaeon]|nr:50S ribosomal protein L10 [Candidatus Nanoarchaeia archaeon]
MYKAKASAEKKDSVDEFAKLLLQYPIVGIVNAETLPSRQLQAMRGKLRSQAEMKLTKRRLLIRAIEKVKDKKPGIEALTKYFSGTPVVLFTKENPFKLFKTIQKNKSKSPIKAGQKAPYDLIVPKGPTSFSPGPVISELAGLRIKAGVEGGKIAIKEDALVLKKDAECSQALSGMLMRLGIEPMEIGLNLVAMYENGMIYDQSVLSIDEDKLKADISQAHSWALNLSVEAGIYNKDSVQLLIMKAERGAKAVDSATKK